MGLIGKKSSQRPKPKLVRVKEVKEEPPIPSIRDPKPKKAIAKRPTRPPPTEREKLLLRYLNSHKEQQLQRTKTYLKKRTLQERKDMERQLTLKQREGIRTIEMIQKTQDRFLVEGATWNKYLESVAAARRAEERRSRQLGVFQD